MSLKTSIRMLQFACIGTVIFGLVLLLGLLPAQSGFNNFYADIAHMPLDQKQSVQSETERLMLAIFAGLMLGFAGFVWQITKHVYANDPALGARLIIPGVLMWYVTDSAGSFIAGAWFNVVMNSFFLALFLVPILMYRSAGTAKAITS